MKAFTETDKLIFSVCDRLVSIWPRAVIACTMPFCFDYFTLFLPAFYSQYILETYQTTWNSEQIH